MTLAAASVCTSARVVMWFRASRQNKAPPLTALLRRESVLHVCPTLVTGLRFVCEDRNPSVRDAAVVVVACCRR